MDLLQNLLDNAFRSLWMKKISRYYVEIAETIDALK